MAPRQQTRRTVLKTISTGVVGGVALSGTAAAGERGLQRELAEVRSATAAYNNPANAEAAGYHAEEAPPVCGMGYHWMNLDLAMTFEVVKTKPEVLAYGERNGNLVLGAVEYAVPKGPEPFFPEPPEDLFENADPEWHVLELPPEAPAPTEELWTLHAWVHNYNPEGVFHPTNPRKLFHPDGCVGDH
ncbi:hypothetical protein [Halapricum hydrolyticum]|uniref:Uncharacterized protein n=1 Tax=Halapricum hydrolyticum TaxID=2979991 RepID=A0AAE3IA05_9EURY|nr:hypothetical protein [Halapricum hydrolyticum]MCU4716596.1 hypothetical protein [Halapricum hydrolyticum]MCU4725799.1 hypothetical protein [Halapricum hydrolyticum]